MAKPTFARDGDAFVFRWPDTDLRVDVSRIEEERGRLMAEVRFAAETEATIGHVYGPVRIDLTGGRDRTELVRQVTGRGHGYDWRMVVEQICLITVREWRGTPQIVPQGMTMSDLMAQEFPPLNEIVPGLLLEGVHLLAGAPKLGKSWAVFGLCLGIAAGGAVLGKVPVPQSEALYLALEDSPRRLKARGQAILCGEPAPRGLHLFTEWPQAAAGGLEVLTTWLDAHPGCRLVVIDTLQAFRGASTGRGRLYEEDYEAIRGLGDLARLRGIAIVIVHHTRKAADADSPQNMISGTLGLSGAADGYMVFERKRGAPTAVLHITSRELADQSLSLTWDASRSQWLWTGDASEAELSSTRTAILDLLRDAPEHLSPADVADALEITRGNAKITLWRMAKDGQVANMGQGRYAIGALGVTAVTGVTPETTETMKPRNVVTTAAAGAVGSQSDDGYPAPVTRSLVTAVQKVSHAPPDPCPDCAVPLDHGVCWQCDSRRCTDCGAWFHGLLSRYCAVCRQKPHD